MQYAINSLLRQKTKTIFIIIIFTILTFLLTSIFFITHSIKYELDTTANNLPQIIIQNQQAGRLTNIETTILDDILQIDGVSDAIGRVWGYYYFKQANVNFIVMGIDNFENQYKKSFTNISNKYDLSDNNSMIIGNGVKKILKKNYYTDYFNFITPGGTLKKVNIKGVFNSNIPLESNDIILTSKDVVREIFGIDEQYFTDIVVKIPNPKEVNTIATKIKQLYPNTKVITQEQLKVSYQEIFDYKSGIFLVLFIVALFTFFMIVYDKSSGLSSEEKREIGILKAIGWKVDDILKEKFYESFIISFFAYLVGVISALIYVYILQAPLLKNIFIGYSALNVDFILPFVLDTQSLFLVFFLSVPIYIAATIIPSWRTATIEADKVLR